MFWDAPDKHHESNAAVIDERGQAISYAALAARVDAAAQHLRGLGTRQLGLLFTSNTVSSLVAYLACLRARHVPLLLPAGMAPELAAALQTHYQPDWIMGAHLDSAPPLAGTQMPIACTAQVPPSPPPRRI